MNHILASSRLPLFLSKFLLLRSIPALEIHSLIKDLCGSTPVPVDGHSLTIQLVSQFIDLGHLIDHRLVREIDGLRNGIVCIFLKSRLHPDMILWGDIMGGHKEFPDVLWNFFNILDIPSESNLPHQVFRIESMVLCQGLKGR